MDVVRLYVTSQLLLTVFLVALLWSLYARLHKQLFFWWWAWAWTFFAGFLAFGAVALRLAPEWTFFKGGLILAAVVCGFIQAPLLVFGACTLRPSGSPARRCRLIGIGVTLAASLLSFALAFHWRGQAPTSFAIRITPRTLMLSAALFFCAWVLFGRWRRTRSWAAGITAVFCLLYAFDQSYYAVFYADRLLLDLGVSVPQFFGQPRALNSLLFFLDLLCSCGICFGTVVVLVEEHQGTERALRECGERYQAIATASAALLTQVRERQRAEAELRESEDRYRDLVEHSQDLICTHDLEGRFLSMNPAPARILGYEVAELLRTPAYEIVFPGSRERYEEYLVKMRKDGVVEGLVPVRTRTGETRIWEYHNTLRTEGVSFPIVRGMAHDVTERQKAEAALRESEELFRTAFAEAAVGLTLTDLKGRFLQVNKAYCKITGYTAEELQSLDFQSITHPEDLPRNVELRSQMLAGDNSIIYQKRYISKSGAIVWVQNSVSAMHDDNGNITNFITLTEDITERKRAEEALRESEDRYRDLVEGSQDFLCTHTLEGQFLFVNPAPARILGYTVEELLQIPLRELLAPEVRDQFPEYLATIRREGVAKGLMVILTRTGERRIWEYRNTLRTKGVPVPIVRGMAHDITERKRAEEALKKSEEKFAKAFRQSPMAITLSSAKDHRFIDVNETFERISGWRRDELIGRTPFDIGAWVNPDERLELKNRLLAEGSLRNLERRFRTRDGRIRIALISVEVIELDGEPCMLTVGADITEQRHAQEALRESEDKLRLLLDSTAEAIFGIDLEGRCTFCNPACLRALGYERVDEVLGKDMHDLIHHSRADGSLLPVEECRILQAFRAGEGVHADDEVLWKANGTSFPAEYRSYPQRRGQAVVGAVITFTDITERKRAEEALRRSEEQLRHAQKMDAVGRLAGGVAHDFNNLLCGITLHLELGLEELKPKDRVLREDLNRALDATRSASSVVRQLLTISRKEVVQRQLVSLNDVVVGVSDLVSRLFRENIYVSLRLAEGLGKASVDPQQMQQVVMNLVLNARDAMTEGGQIVIRTDNVDLDAIPVGEYFTSPPKAGPYVVLEVSDTGYGMSGETLSHLFEPFFTTKELGRGTGLGLATAYGIVTQSDGYISVQTVLGHGTTFKVYLPRVDNRLMEEESSLEAPSVQQSLSPSKPPTILLVDDTEVVRDAVSRDLRQHGYSVLTASNALEALRISEEYRGAIKLLLTDIVMPGMNGPELARHFLVKRPSSKVLYISGHGKETVAANVPESDSEVLLHKPFGSRELLAAIDKVLSE